MKASLSTSVGTFAAPLNQAAQLFGALESKQSDQKPDTSAEAETTTDAAAAAADTQ